MPKKPFIPNFRTSPEDYCKEEVNKLNHAGLEKSALYDDFRDSTTADIVWESEQLAKSAGIYLEFDRTIKGAEKHWYYMIRMANPGGGAITRDQWRVIDELAERHCQNPYGLPTLRLTNRQTVQFHWIKKDGVVAIVKGLAEAGFNTLNGCGDNTRNVMACPLSRFSPAFNAYEWSQKAGLYFQLPLEPFLKIFAIDPQHVRRPEQSFTYGPNLLNRKFKIAFTCLHHAEGRLIPDNCVEMRTHDMGVAPVVENNAVTAYQIYVGGGQGERNGKPSSAMFSEPLAIVSEEQLLATMDAVVKVHQSWGDRQNRFWARVKYVIRKQGVDWYRDQVSAVLGRPLEKPNPELDYGDRMLHHGWYEQPSDGLFSFGAYIENGRLRDDSTNGRLKSMVRETMEKFPVELSITPNQDLIFSHIPADQKQEFEDHLAGYGYGQRNGQSYSALRLRSGACVGRDTCRLTYTDSEKFEPELLDELEKRGWGDMTESIGITGCERQCFRPATKSIGLVGSGLNRYQFKLFGDEAGRHQGQPLISADGENLYLRSVDRERVADVIDFLFTWFTKEKQPGEDLGAFHRRVGADAIISRLQNNPATAELMEKPFTTDCVID
ncbi:MAG: nitrite/sulfite reductase [Candidatus Omnitrophica bacterium]|nr:nitrite/sulfite reductase [Candidatus Omnitrophota bacterium]